MLWNAILNCVVPHIDAEDRKICFARYTSTEELLMKHMEDGDGMPLAKAHAAMNV